MTRNSKLLIGGIALAVAGLGAAGAIARHGPHGWGHGGWGHHGGSRGGPMGMGMFGGPMGMMCRDGQAAEKTDHMLVHIEHRAKPTEAQKAAFEEFKSAARSAATKVQAGCPATAALEPPKDGTPPPRPSPIERLANAETMTAATLDAIKTVRPAAEKFYAALSAEQKAAIDEQPGGEKRGWGWGRHRGPGSGPGDGGPDDRGPGGPEGRGPDRGPGPGDTDTTR